MEGKQSTSHLSNSQAAQPSKVFSLPTASAVLTAPSSNMSVTPPSSIPQTSVTPSSSAPTISLLTSKTPIANVASANGSSGAAAGGIVVVTMASASSPNGGNPLVSVSSGSSGHATTTSTNSTVANNPISTLPNLGHTHIPRGAAVVANMAGNRTSQAVTANAAQRAAHLPKGGLHLAPTSWTRASNASIITSGNSNVTSAISPTIVNANPAITTTKLMRLPASQLPSKPVSQANIITTSSTGIIRSASIARVSNSAVLNVPSASSRGSSLGPITRATSPSVAVSRTIVSPSLPRAVIGSSRTVSNSPAIRPPSASSMMGQPIRLTQTSSQRNLSSGSFTLTSVPQQRQSVVPGGIRPRPTSPATAARLPLTAGSTYVPARNGSLITSAPNNSTLPSRPQSNPSVSSSTISRPAVCSGRPASTGPTPLQGAGGVNIRATGVSGPSGLLRGFSGSPVQTSNFLRTESGLTVRAANSDTVRPPLSRHQQYVQMINTPVQKISTLCSGAPSNPSTIGSSSRNLSFTNTSIGSTPSIAVRITSPAHQSNQVGAISTGAVNIVKTARPSEGSLSAGAPPSITSPPISMAVGSAVATAAAAVLPPGTTITPAVLPPQHHPKETPPPTAPPRNKTTSVTCVGGSSLPNQQFTGNHLTSQQYFVETSPISPVSNNTPSSTAAPQSLTTARCPLTVSSSSQPQRRAVSSSAPPPEQPPPTKPTASPRPSILRKRPDVDGTSKACKNLTGALSSSSSSNSPPSPKRPDSGGNSGASSGSATLSANSSPGGLLIEEAEPPPPDDITTVRSAVAPLLPDGISPRKKPRKQQLTGNELQEAHHSSEEETADSKPISRPAKRFKREQEFEETDGMERLNTLSSASLTKLHAPKVRSSPSKFPQHHRMAYKHGSVLTPITNSNNNTDDINNLNVSNSNNNSETNRDESLPNCEEKDFLKKLIDHRKAVSLLKTYSQTWKPRNNHFIRHSDVKVKESKKSSILSAHKLALQKLEGWKVVHVGGQVGELMEVEDDVRSRLNSVLDTLESSEKASSNTFSKDIGHICELIKANVQRSKSVHTQMTDAREQMKKLFLHKQNVAQIMTKYGSKRQLRKKEKR